MLFTVYSSINDYERLHNTSALLELGQWLERQTGGEVVTTIGDETLTGTIVKLRTANGMLETIPQENEMDGCLYHIQIIAEYTVEI